MLLWLVACAPSECSDGFWKQCPANTARIDGRLVLWQVPAGEPPDDGWPVALLFQGSLTPAQTYWGGFEHEPLGGDEQVALTAGLLDAGFAVLTPQAALGGFWCWNTNVPPWKNNWQGSPDHRLITGILGGIEDGTFGDTDVNQLYAAGISSGGYMTSRMAQAFPGKFSALAIISASWATCVGPWCVIPDTLPEDHPPTFFGHGEDDRIVPWRTMDAYAEALDAQGTPVLVALDAQAGHEWWEGEAAMVVEWFLG